MEETVPNPNDQFFKTIFHFRTEAIEFVKAFFPPDFVSRLDFGYFELDNNSYIDDELKAYYSDMTYTTRLKEGGELRISILLEHKSTLAPPELPEHVQVATYKSGIWRNDLKQGRIPTFVFPAILYHGKRKWKERQFWETFANLPENWRVWVDDIKFLFIDLSRFTDEDLENKVGGTMLYAALIAMKHAYHPKYFFQNLQKIRNFGEAKYSKAEVDSFLKSILSYLEKVTGMNATELVNKAENISPEWKNVLSMQIESAFSDGIKKGMSLKNRQFVITLIQNCPDFSDEKIALLAAVPVEFVKAIKKQLTEKPVSRKRKTKPDLKTKNDDIN